MIVVKTLLIYYWLVSDFDYNKRRHIHFHILPDADDFRCLSLTT